MKCRWEDQTPEEKRNGSGEDDRGRLEPSPVCPEDRQWETDLRRRATELETLWTRSDVVVRTRRLVRPSIAAAAAVLLGAGVGLLFFGRTDPVLDPLASLRGFREQAARLERSLELENWPFEARQAFARALRETDEAIRMTEEAVRLRPEDPAGIEVARLAHETKVGLLSAYSRPVSGKGE